MKKAFWIAAAAIVACIGFAFWQYPKADTYVGPVPSDRILIAYYSQSGHTEAVAKSVQEKTGGRLYRIRTNIQYPRSAPAMQFQVKAEYNERLRPPLSEAMPDMGQYDVVFLGFPNWYNAPPVAVLTFLEQASWQGKVIVPFVTYGLSGWGSSLEDIRAAAPDASLAEGLAVHASQAHASPQRVDTWLTQLGLTLGMWGRKHQQYLKEHRPMLYSDLVLSGKSYSYLADIDTQARNKLHLLVTQLAEKEGINEQLKAQDQMAWVGAMNNIHNRAEKIILQELIYGENAV